MYVLKRLAQDAFFEVLGQLRYSVGALSTWAPHCSANFPDGLLVIAWWSPKPVPVDRAGPTIMSAEPESSARRAGRMRGKSSRGAQSQSAKAL